MQNRYLGTVLEAVFVKLWASKFLHIFASDFSLGYEMLARRVLLSYQHCHNYMIVLYLELRHICKSMSFVAEIRTDYCHVAV